MKKFFIVLAFATMAFMVSCVGDDSSAFAGKWITEDGSESMELFKDGTGVVNSKKDNMSISWKVVDKRFVMTATVLGSSFSEASDYKISGYELTLVNDKGDTAVYVRKEKLEEFKAKKAAAAEAERAKKIAACANKGYKTVKIGSQVWMAENFNCNINGSKCYDNDEANCNKYGRLYNWETAMYVCPKGWHLPSKNEWEVLIMAVGGDNVAGKKLRAKSGWNNNANGTDDYGFVALPGGQYSFQAQYRNFVLSFSSVGRFGYWWSSTGNDSYAYTVNMDIDKEKLRWDDDFKHNLASVRCVQDKANSGEASGKVPTNSQEEIMQEETINKVGDGDIKDSRDSKKYKTVKIGNQTWMAENLNYEANGSVCYENNLDNCKKYGRLYNWETARNVCPSGWRLPSDSDWEILVNIAGSNAGKKLKSNGWGGTDEYGFSALPGGLNASGKFSGVSSIGLWWSATEYDAKNALRYIMDGSHGNAEKFQNEKTRLISVRCIRN